MQMQSALQAAGTTSAAQRAADAQRALIEFGAVPEGLTSPDVTDLTRSLAQQSTESGLSVAARMRKQHEDEVRNIRNSLAARGLLTSGETGHQLGEEQRAYAQSEHDATKQLLDYLAGLQAAFAQGEAERQQSLADTASAAMERQMGLPQNRPTDPSNASLVKGVGFYRGPDGKLYWQKGSEVNYQRQLEEARRRVRELKQAGMSKKRIRNTRAFRRRALLAALTKRGFGG